MYNQHEDHIEQLLRAFGKGVSNDLVTAFRQSSMENRTQLQFQRLENEIAALRNEVAALKGRDLVNQSIIKIIKK